MISEKQLFDRLVTVLSEVETLKADIKQLKDDAVYDDTHNPKGLDKETIKLIAKAAALEVKAKFEEFSGESAAVIAKYKEVTGYDD